MKHIDTFIASDVHLGSPVSRSQFLVETLKKYNFKRLILLGDIFDDLNFKRLKTKDWEFLSYVRMLSEEKSGVEVIWIAGNHDELLIEVMSHLLGVTVLMDYEWTYKDKKYLAIHGHQFDTFMIKNKLVSKTAGQFYKLFQKVDGKGHKLSRPIKRMSKTWIRVSEELAKRALEFGKERKADFIFCGHTHQAMSRTDGDVTYFNTGSWTDIPSTYITIDEGGVLTHEIH